MGQKVHPIGYRLEIEESPFEWKSKWYADKEDYKKYALEDYKIRQLLEGRLRYAGLVASKIMRLKNKIKIVIQASRPGVVIGRGGSGLRELKDELIKLVDVDKPEKNLEIDVDEVKNSDLSAKLVAERIARGLERGRHYRQTVNKAVDAVKKAGAEGVRVVLSGRIAGVEVSRVEKFDWGKVPLSTLRANIDYYQEGALTKSGYVGVKVYINRGMEE
jgi:small subunit ribosomal protein S3